jgi:SAM-dependent MidA family methyltransferase
MLDAIAGPSSQTAILRRVGTPADAIHEAIRASGPIGFDRFMELALYGPAGYYERPPVGPEGDFVTSPHVHPVFGALLGRALVELHEGLGEPRPFRVAELGAGDGTLARQLLEALTPLDVAYTAVERSAGARTALAAVDGIEVADELPSGPHVVVANELLDNLPFRASRDGREVLVGLDGDRLVEMAGDLVPGSPATGEHVEPTGALALLDRLAEAIEAGPAYVLVIDYGAAGEAGGPLHGYADQAVVADVLARPGETDITAGVDVARIAEHATDLGLHAFPTVSQRAALSALGFEAWFREQLDRQHRQLDERDGMGAVRTWAGKSRATLLVDPGGLGRFWWLLLATKGLPAPAFLKAAIAAD